MDVMNSVLRTIEKSRAFQFSENSESRIFESIRQLESRIRIFSGTFLNLRMRFGDLRET
jgi:hypothetical protein